MLALLAEISYSPPTSAQESDDTLLVAYSKYAMTHLQFREMGGLASFMEISTSICTLYPLSLRSAY